MHVTGQTVEFGNDECRAFLATGSEGRFQLGALCQGVGTLARFDFLKLGDQFPFATIQEPANGVLLCLQAKT